MILCADLATAHGSFVVDGWRVWNNATLQAGSKVETKDVPVKVSLARHQTLWIGPGSVVHFETRRILVEKGSANLDVKGDYSITGRVSSGLAAGSNAAELSRTKQIPKLYDTVRELRPTSQRP
jgi:hypothetical protein